MKKITLVLTAVLTMLFAACGVGTYTVNSGNPDEGYLFVVAQGSYTVDVVMDNTTLRTTTVKQNKEWKKRRDIKATAKNMLVTTPGTHDVVVRDAETGRQLFSKKLFISAGETKIVEI